MEKEIKIRMLKNVRPEFLFLAKPGTILRQGMVYDAISNQHGAISGLCSNGEYMGVRPGEFEFAAAPDWVLAIHGKSREPMPPKTRIIKENGQVIKDARDKV